MLYDHGRVPDGFDGSNDLIRFFGSAGLRGYWPFRNGSLVDYSASSATPSNATAVRSPIWKGGQYGGPRGRGTAYYCSGSDNSSNYITVASSSYSSLNGQAEGSISCWAWLGSNPSTYATCVYGDLASYTYNGFGLEINTSGQVYGQVRTVASGGTQNTTAATQLVTGRWYHLALTYSGGVCKLYVNGRFAIYLAGTSGNIQSGFGTLMGARRTNNTDDTNTRTLNGFIAELAVFSRVLSTSQIYNYYLHSVAYEPSPATKYFPSHYIEPPVALRQRVSGVLPKLVDPRMDYVGKARPNFYLTLENSALASYGKTYSPGTGAGLTYTPFPHGGGAVTFAGNNTSYVSLGSTVVTLDMMMTLSFWLRWDNLTTGQSLASGWENTNFVCVFNSTGVGTVWWIQYCNPSHTTQPDTFRIGAYQYTGSIWRVNSSPILKAEVGQWYHFAVAIDQADYNNIRWYKNGERFGDNVNVGGNWSSFANPGGEFRIGWGYTSGSYPSSVAGAIREFQLFHKYTHYSAVREYYQSRIERIPYPMPVIYSAKDIIRQRAALHNRNKAEFLVKGDIRSSL